MVFGTFTVTADSESHARTVAEERVARWHQAHSWVGESEITDIMPTRDPAEWIIILGADIAQDDLAITPQP